MPKFSIPDLDTRFALPIICPVTGETVSAETLYNRASDALGRVVDENIGDLILDNLDYRKTGFHDLETVGFEEEKLCAAVYAWATGVYAQLPVVSADV